MQFRNRMMHLYSHVCIQMNKFILSLYRVKLVFRLFFIIRSTGFPHDQRRFQGYLPRLVLPPFKLFQH